MRTVTFGDSPTKPPFGVASRDITLIRPEVCTCKLAGASSVERIHPKRSKFEILGDVQREYAVGPVAHSCT